MSWFFRIAAPIALLTLVGMGAYLIVDGRSYSGLGLLAITVTLQWMGVIPEATPHPADGALLDQEAASPPLPVLVALGIAGVCFVLAVVTRR
jgi:hypothetical protein